MKIEVPEFLAKAVQEYDSHVAELGKEFPGIKFESVKSLAAYIGERFIAIYKETEKASCPPTKQPNV